MGPRQHVSRSMNNGPSFVLSTLPGCGSPCSSCSGALRSPIARRRLPSVVAEKPSVGVGELRREIRAGHELFGLRDSIRERRARYLERAHADVQPLQRLGVVGAVRPRVRRARSRSTASPRSHRRCAHAGPREARACRPGTRLRSSRCATSTSNCATSWPTWATRATTSHGANRTAELVRVVENDRVIRWQVDSPRRPRSPRRSLGRRQLLPPSHPGIRTTADWPRCARPSDSPVWRPPRASSRPFSPLASVSARRSMRAGRTSRASSAVCRGAGVPGCRGAGCRGAGVRGRVPGCRASGRPSDVHARKPTTSMIRSVEQPMLT